MIAQPTLKPCPFCGAGEHRLQQCSIVLDSTTIHTVECMNCGAERADDESQAAADAAWNQRAHTVDADLLELAYQYQSDLRHPPTADSVTRRLERIAAVLAKVGA